jgi:tRNA threonylcarbamoyladenosine biosynthesis protein TsaB
LASLFIDSTYDITLGILDDEMGWISFQRFIGQRSSNILQKETYNLLTAAGLKASELKHVITVAGPGFYTGLRLSEGVADVFKFAGLQSFSFYTYQIPALLGIDSGFWMTKAYRGEYFFHVWDKNQAENILVTESELPDYIRKLDGKKCFIHSDTALDTISRSLLKDSTDTHSLLQSHSQKILTQIMAQDSRVDSFYFRAPEDEFRVSK